MRMRAALDILRVTAITAVVMLMLFVAAVLLGYVVKYWDHVVNYALIIFGIGGIVCLTLWSD